MAAVKTVSLTKEYSDGEHYLRAVDDISFTVEETEFVAIIGSSGCGKTTLLNLLGGLENPTHGCIYIIQFATWSCSDTSSSEVWLFGSGHISLGFRQGLCYDSFHTTSISPQSQRQCYRHTDKPQPLQYHHLLGNFLLVLAKS